MAPLDGADSWLQNLLLPEDNQNPFRQLESLPPRFTKNSNLHHHWAGLCRLFDTIPRPFDKKNLIGSADLFRRLILSETDLRPCLGGALFRLRGEVS